MDRSLGWAERLAAIGAWFGGLLIVAAAFLIGFDVAIRKLFNVSVGGADELSGYALAIGTTWSLSFTLLHRAHVRIDSLYAVFPRPMQALLDIVGVAGFVCVFGMIAWYGYGMFADSLAMNAHSMSPLSTPLAVPQLLWVAGLVLFVCLACVVLFRAVLLLATGNVAAVRQVAGSRNIEEEIEEERSGTPTSGRPIA